MDDLRSKIRGSRKKFLPLLLAVTGSLAGSSLVHAANTANIDLTTGYTIGSDLVGQGWGAWGTTGRTTNPVKVDANGAVLASVATSQAVYKQYNPYQLAAAGRVFVRVDFNVSSAAAGGADFFLVNRELNNTTGAVNLGTPDGKSFFRTYIKSSGAGFVIGWNPNSASGGTTPPPFYDSTVLNFNQTYTILIRYDAVSGSTYNDVSYIMVNPTWAADPTSLPWISGLTRSDWTGNNTVTSGVAIGEFSSSVSSGSSRIPGILGLVLKQNSGNALAVSKILIGDTLADVGILPPVPDVPTSSAATAPNLSGFTANWTASAGAAGYYLDVSTDSGFATFVAGYNAKDVGAVVSSSVTGSFAVGTTLYYRVRAYNPAGSSANSATQQAVIIDNPVVLFPNVTNNTTSGTVSWTSGPGWAPNNPVSASNATVTFTGPLSGPLTANNDSAGNFQLNSLVFSNTGSGNLNLTGNPLQFVSSGGTNPVLAFATTATVLQSVVNNIQIDADLTVNQVSATVSNSIIAGIISGSGGISKIGAGYAYITGVNNSFGGPVTVRAGFLGVPTFGMSGQISSLGTNGTIYLGNSSETSQIRGTQSANQTSDKTIVLGGSGAFNYIENYGTTGTVLTLSGNIDTSTNGLKSLRLNPKNGPIVISGTIGANMPDNQLSLMLTNGTQQLTLTRSNAYNGGTYLQGGSLALSNSSALGTGLVNLYGVTITALTNINLTNNFQFAGAGVTASITATQKVDLTNQISGNIAGFMGVDGIIRIHTSFATAYLANPTNTYSSVLITQGAIAADSLGVAGSPSPLGTSGTITFGNGGVSILKYLGSGETNAKTLAFAAGASQWSILEHRGTGPLKLTTPLKIERTSANTLILESQPSGSGELAGSITNVEGVDIALNGTRLAKSGTGDWILSASNDYRNTSVQEGRLIAENPNALPAARDVEMAGGTLLLNFSGDGATLGNLCLTNFKSSPNRYINTAVVPETFKFNSSTIDLGTNRSSTLVFSSATNWITNQLSNSNIVETYGQNQYLKVAKSSTGGKLYITNTNGVPLSRILNAENTNFTANITAQGLVYFNLPGNDAPAITTRGNFTVIENRTAVSIVTAFDPDMNALTYSIAGGSDGALFRIDSETGVLTFAYAPDYESPTDLGRNNVYNLTVVVSDGQLTDEKQIAVTLTNETDSPSDYKAGWLMANGLATNSDWSADPNSVGYSLATAYAFGLNPSVREGEPASLASSSAGSVKIVYLQRDDKDISGVTYTVKSGTDLAEGLNGTVTPSPSANQPSPPKPGYTQYEATYTAPAPATKGFLKVQAFVP